MLTLALGTAACGAGQDFADSETVQNSLRQDKPGSQDDSGPTTSREDGANNNDDGFISIGGNDGSTFTCEGGECNLFIPGNPSADF